MRGRKPKPTFLRVISNNAGHRPINQDEPQPAGVLYEPPAFLSDEQRAEWVYALEHAPLGLLRQLDRAVFAQWCIASCDLVEAEIALRAEGKVVNRGGDKRVTINPDNSKTQTVRSPSMVKNPWIVIKRDAFDRLMKATSELGFSPTSRSRITLAGGGAKKENRFSNNAAKKA